MYDIQTLSDNGNKIIPVMTLLSNFAKLEVNSSGRIEIRDSNSILAATTDVVTLSEKPMSNEDMFNALITTQRTHNYIKFALSNLTLYPFELRLVDGFCIVSSEGEDLWQVACANDCDLSIFHILGCDKQFANFIRMARVCNQFIKLFHYGFLAMADGVPVVNEERVYCHNLISANNLHNYICDLIRDNDYRKRQVLFNLAKLIAKLEGAAETGADGVLNDELETYQILLECGHGLLINKGYLKDKRVSFLHGDTQYFIDNSVFYDLATYSQWTSTWLHSHLEKTGVII